MIIIPAIDVRGGKCVRLTQGDFDRETVYGEDPVEMAARWEKEGADWLHVVDLDGAKAGRPVQLAIVERMRERVRMRIELGGGIRTIEDVRAAFAAGVDRLILGTAAIDSPELLEECARDFEGRIYVALDARHGKVATRGWTEVSRLDVREAAHACERRGAAGFLFTDISRDGTGEGVNVESTAALAREVSVPVIASGGVSSVEDVRRLRAVEKDGVAAVIVGRALYTGAVRLAEAIAAGNR